MKANLLDVDLKLLRVFQAVARHRGFSAAQDELDATQSAISMSMAQLESRLGMRLCERGVKGFQLTEYGKEVLTLSEKLFASIDDFRTETSRLKGQITGTLRIGIVDNVSFDPRFPLPKAIKTLDELYPDMTIEIFVGASQHLEERIMDGRIRAGIGVDDRNIPQFFYKSLFVEEFELFVSDQHPFFAQDDECLSNDLLAKARFADFETYPSLSPPIKLKRALSCPYIEALANLVLSGVYIAFLPREYVKHWVQAGKMRSIRPDELRCGSEIRLAYRKSTSLAPELEALIDILTAL